MSGIFGIVDWTGAPLADSALETMTRSLAHWQGHIINTWHSQSVGLGAATLGSTPEARYECLPRCDQGSGVAFVASGRLDNRSDLSREMGIAQPEQARLSDAELMLQAYLRWGAKTAERIFGDWSFAAWHPRERTLFLARDHFGYTSLFYFADTNRFAFAPTRQALLDLDLCPVELDEFYLAQVLVSWPAHHDGRTIHRPIRRLPPAHTLTITPERMELHQYWRLEDVPELRWPRREDYVEAFSTLFDQAVSARLRAPDRARHLAVALSGGLDSSSVAASAAGLLQEQNQRLAAFLSLPLSDSGKYTGDRFGDEYPFAAATAQFIGNVELNALQPETLSPLEGIRRQLEILDEPLPNAAHAYWILDMEQAVQSRGFRILLTAQMGDAGISWTGDLLSQPLAVQLHHLGLAGCARSNFKALKDQISRATFATGLRNRKVEPRQWYRQAAIRPAFAQRLNLLEQWLNDPRALPPRGPKERRYRILRPGGSAVGAMHAEIAAAHGLEIRDPRQTCGCLSSPYLCLIGFSSTHKPGRIGG